MAEIRIGKEIRLFNLKLPSWVREHLIGTHVPVIAQTQEHYILLREDLLKVLKRGDTRQRGVWYYLSTIPRTVQEQISLPRSVCQLVHEPSSGGGMAG